METGMGTEKPVDAIQKRLTDYAISLDYSAISPQAIHATKTRIIDWLGALIGGFEGEPCRIAQCLAAQIPYPTGATVLGTRLKTTVDLAAFANGITGRYVEMNDAYHRPGVFGGHPSDVLGAVLAVAEHVHADGRSLITAAALAYETYLRLADAVLVPPGFDYTNYVCIGSATAAAKLLGLTPVQLSHAISIAVVPNNSLFQARTGHLSMWKAAAAGQACKSGVFAAQLAAQGMEGAHTPFEGAAGWCDYVTRRRFAIGPMGSAGEPFKVEETIIKPRALCAATISSVLASEQIAPLADVNGVKEIIVEVYKKAKNYVGTGAHCWNPDSRETADHSIPYVVAAALIDGTVTPRSLDDDHLWNPAIRSLMMKINVVENEDYTKAYETMPVEHHIRITVVMKNGEKLTSKVGGSDGNDLGERKTDEQISQKFKSLAADGIGPGRSEEILKTLWRMEEMADVSEISASLPVR